MRDISIQLPSGGGPSAKGFDALILGLVIEQANGSATEDKPEIPTSRSGIRVLLFDALPSPSPVPTPEDDDGNAEPTPTALPNTPDDDSSSVAAAAAAATVVAGAAVAAALIAGRRE